MLPRLTAEESLTAATRVAVGSRPPQETTSVQQSWERDAQAGQRPVKATPADLAALGIDVQVRATAGGAMTIDAGGLGRTVMELSTDSTTFFTDLDKAKGKTLELGKTFDKVAKDLGTFAAGVKAGGQQTVAAGELISKAFAASERDAKGLVDATRQLAGADLIAKAHNYAEAVEAIGGASKLTAANQKEVNATVTQAIAQYQLLGRAAPDSLHKLATATTQVEQKASLASKATDVLKSSFFQLTAALSVANLIERAVSGLIAFGKAAFDNAGKMVDLSNKSGLTLKTIQQFEHVSAQSGVSIDTLTDSVFKLGTTLAEGKGSARQAVKDLGLEFEALKRSKPDDAFNDIMAALEKMPPGFDRSLAMQRLFGKGAKEVSKLVADGYTEMAESAKLSSDDQIKALDAAGDAWTRFQRDTQTSIASLLGTLVLAGEQASKTPLWRLMLGSSMDMNRTIALLAVLRAEAAKVRADINLPLEGPSGLEAYRRSLQGLRDDLVKLTPAQKSVIVEADKLGQSAADMVAGGIGIAEDAIQNYLDALKDLTKGQKEADKAFEEGAKRTADRVKAFEDEAKAIRELNHDIGLLVRGHLTDLGDKARDVLSKATAETAAWIRAMTGGIPVVKGLGEALKNVGEQVPVGGLDPKFGAAIQEVKDRIDAVGDGLREMGRAIGGTTGTAISSIGSLVSRFGDLKDAIELAGRAGATTSQKLAAGFSTAAYVIALASFAFELFRSFKAADEQLAQLKRQALDTAGGMQALRDQARLAGVDIDAIFTQKDDTPENFTRQMQLAQQAIAGVDARLERLGLTWRDLNQTVRQGQIGNAARQILDDIKFLTNDMLDRTSKNVIDVSAMMTKIAKATSGSLNQLIVDAVKTGTKIPAALRPIIEHLIRIGGLTDAAARAILGLAEDTMPSLADIKEAAERYGVTLDQLGPKVKQLQINETAAQIVKDWKTLSLAGADVATIMRKAIQDVVTDALRLGLTLPASMRPILQALVDSGQLTDAFGNKLMNLDGLNFETPLVDKIEDLIDAIRDLIAETSAFGDEAEHQFNRARGAAEAFGRAVPRGSVPAPGPSIPRAGPGSGGTGDGDTTFNNGDRETPGVPGDRTRGASGGYVTTEGIERFGRRLLQFTPRGTDTVPALLTPGEVIFNADQQAALGAVLGSTLRGIPYAGSPAMGLRATGTEGSPAAPSKTVHVTNQITIQAIDGASVERVVKGRSFAEALKATLTNDTHGLRTHVVDVTS